MKRNNSVRKIAFIGIMSAISTVLMMINFPLPLAPSFLKFDISELPALFVGFFMGPMDGCIVVVIKNLLKLLFTGTETAFVGEFMNVMGSVCYVLPAALIYRKYHTKKGAIASLVISTIFVSIVFIFINAYIAFPLYGRMYGLSMEAIVAMGTAVNPRITDLKTLMLYSIFPFNLFKHGVTSYVTYLLYKKIGSYLKKTLERGVSA